MGGYAMKKQLLTILCLALSFWACNRETIPTQEAEGRFTLTFEASFPAMRATTKSLSEEPGLQNLYIAVFGPSGALNEYVRATTLNGPDPSGRYTFSVNLTPIDGPVSLHFIANGPASLPYGFEDSLISSLVNHIDDALPDSYWQRLILQGGLHQGIDLSAFGDIVLIRNYCKLSLRSSTSDLRLIGYELINTPTVCHTALYINGAFVDNYQNMTYDQVRARYAGSGWTNLSFNTGIKSDLQTGETGLDYNASYYGSTAAQYMYQRSLVSSSVPTFIIAKGEYSDGNVYYYKINLTNDNGYIPLFRNFHYDFNITQVNAAGALTPYAAAQGSGSGDVFVDIHTSFDSELSDGAGANLQVGYTEKVFSEGGEYILPVRYTVNNILKNEDIRFSAEGDETTLSTSLPDGAVISGGTVVNDEIVYTVKNPSVFARQRVNLIAGSFHEILTFYSQAPIEIRANCNPGVVAPGLGKSVNLEVRIPNYLYPVIFPLTLDIKVVENSLSPSQGSGLSVVSERGDSSVGSFAYRYILSYDQYQALSSNSGFRLLNIPFTTSKENSASSVIVTTDRSNPAVTSFSNSTPSGSFSGLNFDNYEDVTPAQGLPIIFNYSTSTIADMSVTLGPGFEPANSYLTLVGTDNNGNRTYRLGVVSSGIHQLSLKTTASYTSGLGVTLSAQGYSQASKTLQTQSTQVEVGQEEKTGVRNADMTIATNTGSFKSDKRNSTQTSVRTESDGSLKSVVHTDRDVQSSYYRMDHNTSHTNHLKITSPSTLNMYRIEISFSSKGMNGVKVLDGGGSVSNGEIWTGDSDEVRFECAKSKTASLSTHNDITSVKVYYKENYTYYDPIYETRVRYIQQ